MPTNKSTANRLLAPGDLLRLRCCSSPAATVWLIVRAVDPSIEVVVAYWHPSLGDKGGVVTYAASGSFSDEGRIELKPTTARREELNDEFLMQSLKKHEPKGWGRYVKDVITTWIDKHTHHHKTIVEKSWSEDTASTTSESKGAHSRKSALALQDIAVQEWISDGYEAPRQWTISLFAPDSRGLRGQLSHQLSQQIVQFNAKTLLREHTICKDVQSYVRKLDGLSSSMCRCQEIRASAVRFLQESMAAADAKRFGHPLATLHGETFAPLVDLRRWKHDLVSSVHQASAAESVKILLYGGTGEGKSSVINALLGMADVSPSDCSGRAVTSCTVRYIYRAYGPVVADRPVREHDPNWVNWLARHTAGRSDIPRLTAPVSQQHKRYGATMFFMTPDAFYEEQRQLVDVIEEYWMKTRKEKRIPMKLPHSEQSEAYPAMQKLVSWYGASQLLKESAGWADGEQLLKYLKKLEPNVTGICYLKKGSEEKPFQMQLEHDDQEQFCTELAAWVTVGSKLNLVHFLIDARVFLPNEILKGVEVWDLAGVGDDNRHRAAMAEQVLHQADFVWVLAKIARAMSNQMAQQMLRSLFRKVLLDKSGAGEITFVLTHSDIVNESEVQKSYGLESGSRRDMALVRAEHVRWESLKQLQGDLAGRERGSSLAGGSPQGTDVGTFGCFAVSATECLRCEGVDHRPPQTFSEAAETQIPALRQQLHLQALKRNIAATKAPVMDLCSSLRSIVAHLSDVGTSEEHRRRETESIVKVQLSNFKRDLSGLLQAFEACAVERLEKHLKTKINAGAQAGRQQASGTVGEWNTHSVYHHATYKGMVRRNGVWCHPNRGSLDWPEELAGPVYNRFTKEWRLLFGEQLPDQVKTLRRELGILGNTVHTDLLDKVVSTGCRTKAQVQGLQSGIDIDWLVERRCSQMLARVKSHGVDVTGTVQDHVTRDLKAASQRCSHGCYADQKSAIRRAATGIDFEETASGLVRGLSFVEQEVKMASAALASELTRAVEIGYEPLWRKLTEQQWKQWAELRERLLPQMRPLLLELEKDVQMCVSYDNEVSRKLVELVPTKPGKRSSSVSKPVDWMQFLGCKPEASKTPQKKRPAESACVRPTPPKVSKIGPHKDLSPVKLLF